MEKPDKSLNWRFVTLAIGMFAIGTDSFVVAGILPSVAEDLDVDVPTSAELITAYALAYAVLSPVVAAVAARVPRRLLLLSGLLVFIAGNIGTGLATGFEVALGFRVMAALGGAMFTPTAAGVVVALAGPERRGTALSILFGGLSAATALGSPLGTAISGFTDWRGTMIFVAAVGLVAAIAVGAALPSVPSPPAVTLKQRLSPVADPRIALTLLLVLVGYSGLFVLYTYVSQVFAPATDGSGRTLAWLLFAWGVAAVAGNMTTGRLTDKFGNRVVINAAGAIAVAVFATSPWSSRHLATAVVAVMLWGACGWAMLVPIQHRLAGVDPANAQMSISLSSSANYVGVSLAPVAGRFFLEHDVEMRYLGVPSAVMVVAGLLIGEAGYLLIRRKQRQVEADGGDPAAEGRTVAAR
ncbi:MFS transporter [Streptomyces thermospinosisporus]|uniref:MFS transporter n=1 Tax=Streptomyces thermospinosisporus TaxID=161482 RepID=A0ABP4JUU2_9ACTN